MTAAEAPPAPTSTPVFTPSVGPTPPAVKEVRALDVAPGKESAPPKPSSARDDLYGKLAKKAGVEPAKAQKSDDRVEKPEVPEKTEEPTEVKEFKTDEVPRGTEPGPKVDPKTGKPEKVNPWRVVDEYKAKVGSLEAEVAKLKTSVVPEAERATLTERVTKAEARALELEDHIRFVDYEKSNDFRTKYQAPYEKAWANANKELGEVPVVDPTTGEQRAATPADILKLVNLPLGEARAEAKQLFGEFVDDAMRHRKSIRDIFDQRQEALEDARKNGAQREIQSREQVTATQKRMAAEVGSLYTKYTDAVMNDPENGSYFKKIVPKEGEQATPEESEWNDFLDKGYALVEKAWTSNPADPKLTAEQRDEIVRSHVALRNRAAAFGPMKRKLIRMEARLKKAESDLAAYAST